MESNDSILRDIIPSDDAENTKVIDWLFRLGFNSIFLIVLATKKMSQILPNFIHRNYLRINRDRNRSIRISFNR